MDIVINTEDCQAISNYLRQAAEMFRQFLDHAPQVEQEDNPRLKEIVEQFTCHNEEVNKFADAFSNAEHAVVVPKEDKT